MTGDHALRKMVRHLEFLGYRAEVQEAGWTFVSHPTRPDSVGEFLAWDAVHDELVMSGGVLSQRPPHANNYSLIYRVRPDGTPRRVFLGFKLGKRAPRVDGISGLAVDRAGAIYFGAGVVSASGSVQVMRLDESKGMPVVVAGAPAPTGVNHGDGPAGQAHFAPFRSLCVGRDGTIYTAEASNVIRKVTPAG